MIRAITFNSREYGQLIRNGELASRQDIRIGVSSKFWNNEASAIEILLVLQYAICSKGEPNQAIRWARLARMPVSRYWIFWRRTMTPQLLADGLRSDLKTLLPEVSNMVLLNFSHLHLSAFNHGGIRQQAL